MATTSAFVSASVGTNFQFDSGKPATRVVIVGAGFCGTLLATLLLRHAVAPLHIFLIEQEAVGGVAYGNHASDLLLNTPAGKMSAESDAMSFVRFAQRLDRNVTGDQFLSRRLYGEYLQSLLTQAEESAPLHAALTRVHAKVNNIAAQGSRWHVELNDGATLVADDVVLATGNPSPKSLPGAAHIANHPGYVHSPWELSRSRLCEQLRSQRHSNHRVLIVGTGLSMADVVAQLRSANANVAMHAISRRGLLPLSHLPARETSTSNTSFAADVHQVALQRIETLLIDSLLTKTSLRELLRAIRSLVNAVNGVGGGWQDAISLLRTCAPRLWSGLPVSERQRFLRHLQAYWDIHRHRLPPNISRSLRELQRIGALRVNAGRIHAFEPHDQKIKVTWRARGRSEYQTMLVDAVINATGPDYCLAHTQDSLLRSLHSNGLIADDASLGLKVTAGGAVIDAGQRPHHNLFYVGPMLRATYWEATAVPELRQHVERLARSLSERWLKAVYQDQRAEI